MNKSYLAPAQNISEKNLEIFKIAIILMVTTWQRPLMQLNKT